MIGYGSDGKGIGRGVGKMVVSSLSNLESVVEFTGWLQGGKDETSSRVLSGLDGPSNSETNELGIGDGEEVFDLPINNEKGIIATHSTSTGEVFIFNTDDLSLLGSVEVTPDDDGLDGVSWAYYNDLLIGANITGLDDSSALFAVNITTPSNPSIEWKSSLNGNTESKITLFNELIYMATGGDNLAFYEINPMDGSTERSYSDGNITSDPTSESKPLIVGGNEDKIALQTDNAEVVIADLDKFETLSVVNLDGGSAFEAQLSYDKETNRVYTRFNSGLGIVDVGSGVLETTVSNSDANLPSGFSGGKPTIADGKLICVGLDSDTLDGYAVSLEKDGTLIESKTIGGGLALQTNLVYSPNENLFYTDVLRNGSIYAIDPSTLDVVSTINANSGDVSRISGDGGVIYFDDESTTNVAIRKVF